MSSDQPDPHEEERMSSDQPAHDETNVEPRTMRFQGVPSQESEHVEVDGRGLSAEDQATIEALRPGTALLVVLRGPNTGARFLLDDARGRGRPPPRLRHLPRRRDGLAQARALRQRRRRLRRA